MEISSLAMKLTLKLSGSGLYDKNIGVSDLKKEYERFAKRIIDLIVDYNVCNVSVKRPEMKFKGLNGNYSGMINIYRTDSKVNIHRGTKRKVVTGKIIVHDIPFSDNIIKVQNRDLVTLGSVSFSLSPDQISEIKDSCKL